jgi:hypothetical protein
MTTNQMQQAEQGQVVAFLRDQEGALYALPLTLIEAHRVPDAHRAEVEQFLGENDVAGHLSPFGAAAAGTAIQYGLVYIGTYGGALAGWLVGGGSLSTMPWNEVGPIRVY